MRATVQNEVCWALCCLATPMSRPTTALPVSAIFNPSGTRCFCRRPSTTSSMRATRGKAR